MGKNLTKISSIWPDFPYPELVLPPHFVANKDGIWWSEIVNNKEELQLVMTTPVFITTIYNEVKSQCKYLNLTFLYKGKWQTLEGISMLVIASNAKLLDLARYGLDLHSQNIHKAMYYINAYKNANLYALEEKQAVDSMGWHEGRYYLPSLTGKDVLYTHANKDILECLRFEGSYEDWLSMAKKVRAEGTNGRFAFAIAFAPILLQPLNISENYISLLWDNTSTGKTLLFRVAASCWGSPDFMMTLKGTENGLEARAALFNDMPLILDELQNRVNEREYKGSMASLIYLLYGGKGKLRSKKDSTAAAMARWRTVVAMSGEQSLLSEASTGGLYRRVLEVGMEKPLPEELRTEILQCTSKNYGWAAPLFIDTLTGLLKDRPERLHELYQKFCNELLEIGQDQYMHSLIYACALYGLCDYLASFWLFGADDTEQAYADGLLLANNLLEQASTQEAADDALRAYAFIQEHTTSHYSAFEAFVGENSKPVTNGTCLGFFKDGRVYYIPKEFDRILRQNGFEPLKIRRALASKGLLITDTGRMDKRVRIDFNGKSSGAYICMEYQNANVS